MTMQQTPLLMSRILGRGATLDPNEEVVTLLERGDLADIIESLAVLAGFAVLLMALSALLLRRQLSGAHGGHPAATET